MEILIGALVLLLIFGVILYNSLIGKKNQIDNAFASIDVMLLKRADLIPNLVESVKQYMSHERGLLTEITELRASVMSPQLSADEKITLQNKISDSLGKILVSVENYPELKADSNFDTLMRSLNEVEEQLSASRRSFNAAVTAFNNAVEMFPSNIIAGMMNLSTRHLLETPAEKRADVKVADLFNKQ